MIETTLPLAPALWPPDPRWSPVRRAAAAVRSPPDRSGGLDVGAVRLSRRDEQQALQELWEIRVSLGAVGRQEQAQSTALATVACPIKGYTQSQYVERGDDGWERNP